MRWQAPFAIGIGEDNEPAGTSSSENSRTRLRQRCVIFATGPPQLALGRVGAVASVSLAAIHATLEAAVTAVFFVVATA